MPKHDTAWCLLLAGIGATGILTLTSWLVINPDVAFLAWAADQVTGPAVYGRDILDVNPPLCMLVYMPAVLLAKAVGLDWGIRLWMSLLMVLSVVTLWHAADKSLRLRVAVVLLAFVLLAYPNHFAQREQIALLLCAPYVAGAARGRGHALLSGVMAGAGFLMKPHFLVPLALVFALRRRIGMEERAILATGLAYGVALLLFFQPYLFDMVPKAAAAYWAISYPENLLQQSAIIAVAAGLSGLLASPQPEARPYLAATAGFTAAALLQQKGFFYHFLPAFAFLAMYLAVSLRNARPLAARLAAVFLIGIGLFQAGLTASWLREEIRTAELRKTLDAEIDRSRSFAALAVQPAAAFPQAIRSSSRFTGSAISQIFLPAVIAEREAGVTGSPADRLAREQALRDLSSAPDLVLVSNTNHDGEFFDVLGWLAENEDFRTLWKHYHATRHIAGVTLYRRE